jgi:hypothetical protein
LLFNQIRTDLPCLGFAKAFPQVLDAGDIDIVIAVYVDGAARLALAVAILDPIPLHLDELLLNLGLEQSFQLLVYGIQLIVGFQEKFGGAIGPIIRGLGIFAIIRRKQAGKERKTKNVCYDKPIKHKGFPLMQDGKKGYMPAAGI